MAISERGSSYEVLFKGRVEVKSVICITGLFVLRAAGRNDCFIASGGRAGGWVRAAGMAEVVKTGHPAVAPLLDNCPRCVFCY